MSGILGAAAGAAGPGPANPSQLQPLPDDWNRLAATYETGTPDAPIAPVPGYAETGANDWRKANDPVIRNAANAYIALYHLALKRGGFSGGLTGTFDLWPIGEIQSGQRCYRVLGYERNQVPSEAHGRPLLSDNRILIFACSGDYLGSYGDLPPPTTSTSPIASETGRSCRTSRRKSQALLLGDGDDYRSYSRFGSFDACAVMEYYNPRGK